jgi:hypothetical protein
MEKSWVKYFIIVTFVSLYLVVSIISTIHVVQFFDLTNPKWLSVSLAIAFELGAAASLASLIALDKMNKFLVWVLFIVLTAMQAMGNTYYAYINIDDFQYWSELFGLAEEEVIFQKRILSIISGAILPLVALGFIKSLVDYIRPEQEGPVLSEPVNRGNIGNYVENEDILDIDGQGVYQDIQDRISDMSVFSAMKNENDADLDLVVSESGTEVADEDPEQFNYVNVNDQTIENNIDVISIPIMTSGTQEISRANSNGLKEPIRSVPPYHLR